MPSMTASKAPPTTAFLAAVRGPARSARMPPVAAPERMGFQASSLWRTATKEQSQTEKRAPQTAKFPPKTGARYCKVGGGGGDFNVVGGGVGVA